MISPPGRLRELNESVMKSRRTSIVRTDIFGKQVKRGLRAWMVARLSKSHKIVVPDASGSATS
ncbi:MAG: hypothetical protein ACKO3T_26025 [Planctomycetaceae bacterium]